MLMPSIFGENLFDDWMMDPFERDFFNRRVPASYQTTEKLPAMKTDIRELEGSYELDIDLPGFKKEVVAVKLENGCLTISASKSTNKDEKNAEGKYIRRERYQGQCARSFYVGEEVRQEDIRAKFEDGILKVSVPKVDAKAVEQKKYIAIEG